MPKYAQIVNGNVIQVVEQNPADIFHPDIAVNFVEVPDEVETYYLYDDQTDTFSPPPPPLNVAPPTVAETPTIVDAIGFLDLFTMQEELAIRQARAAGDLVVESFMDRLDKAQRIHLDDPRVIAGVDYLVTATLITAERRDEILAGQAPTTPV